MLQRGVLVLSLPGVGEGPVHRRGGRKLRRGGVVAGTSRLPMDRGWERIPIGHAERLGDQFEALADGDVETLRSESRTQGVRHGFGVAEVAHDLILCLNETGGARACVADPFVRAKGYERLRYVHHTPKGRKRQGASTVSNPNPQT